MKKFLVTIMMLLPMLVMAYDFEVDGIFYNITSIEEKTVEVTYSTDLNYQQDYIVIPAEVTWNNYTFSVKGIGMNAFDSGNFPNKVETIIISKGIEYIGELAFQCQRLKKIQIPNTVKSIGSNAFSSGNERNITTDWYVEDYEWLCTIGHFFSYPHVKDIYVDNKKLDGDFIIPEGVPYISSHFWGCDWIKNLSIPSTVSYVSGSFSRCTNLESVEIKEGVKNLYGQFDGCTSLKSVTLPNSLVSIGDYVFHNCPALIDIQSFITEPFPTDGFTNGQYLSATLKVPYGTKGKYQKTEGWKNFVNIEESSTINKYKLTYIVDGEEYKSYELDYGVSITPEPAPTKEDYTFSGWSEIPETMPAHDVTVTGTFTYAGATATVTISSVGQGTYCYNQDLDFTNVDGIKAYVASGFNPSDGNILLMRVKEVPAGTGLLVKGNAGTYTIPVKDTQFYYLNMFKPVFAATTVATEEGSNTNYVLANGSEGLKFYKSSGASLAANRAYLQIPTSILGNHSNARSIGYTFDDEEGITGIDSINEDTNEGAFYNLNGQRVTAPRKGIYVRNGKKMFIKK